jgi:hypothetical protein
MLTVSSGPLPGSIIPRLTSFARCFLHEFVVDKPQGPCYGGGIFRRCEGRAFKVGRV